MLQIEYMMALKFWLIMGHIMFPQNLTLNQTWKVVTPLCFFLVMGNNHWHFQQERDFEPESEEGPWSLVPSFWLHLCILSPRGESLCVTSLLGPGGTEPLCHGCGRGGVLPHHCSDPVQILHQTQVSFFLELMEHLAEAHRGELMETLITGVWLEMNSKQIIKLSFLMCSPHPPTPHPAQAQQCCWFWRQQRVSFIGVL